MPGVTAIPVSAFYDAPDAPSHYARFAFCKRDEVLDEAVARLRAHFGPRALTADRVNGLNAAPGWRT